MPSHVLVFITASSREEAHAIGKTLIQEKLAACAGLIPGIESLYVWEGRFCDERECLLLLKSREDLVDSLILRVKALHSYKVPEILTVRVEKGNPEYIRWIDQSLGFPDQADRIES
jgi:periplasmic divalent cation tolerance protein